MIPFQKHLRAGTVTGTIVALGATVAIALAAGAEDNYFATRLLQAFVLGAPNDLKDLNSPLSGAHFDIAAYKAHPCYDIVGNEREMCEEQYGLRESMRSLLERGVVTSYLKQRGLLTVNIEPAQNIVLSQTSRPTTGTFTYSPHQQMMTERGKRLWSVCRNRAGSWSDAQYCYARNVRLLSRFNVVVEGNVH